MATFARTWHQWVCVALLSARSLSAQAATTAEQVTFRSGDVTLAGTLYLPSQPGRHPAIVALHASNGGSRDSPAYQHLASAVPAAGFAVLLYDRRGEGASGGSRPAGFDPLVADGVAAVAYLRSRPDIDSSRIGVWGLSQGGWLAPLVATKSRDVAFAILVSAPGVTPARQMDYTASYALRAAGEPPDVVNRALHVRAVVDDYYRGRVTKSVAEAAVNGIQQESWFSQVFLPVGGRLPDDPTHSLWGATMDYDPLATLARLTVPVVFFFADDDAYVPVEESMTLVRKATRASDVTVLRVPGTDHAMETGGPASGGQTSTVYIQELLDWLRRRR